MRVAIIGHVEIIPRTSRILDALHVVLIVHYVYFYLVINYANITALTKIVWSFKVSCYILHEPLLSY
ncbi:hypothetical protein BDR04DRAFT_1020282 [Suillus decipiens]|nr:hypothetical protein BDR04DRAFT_1020282 [Suillus decipiens]